MTALAPADTARDSSSNGIASAVKDEKKGQIDGLYYLDEVCRFLRATDLSARRGEVSLSSQQISGWSRRGFFDLQKDKFERNRRFMQFPHLITSRMIAILRSYGISIQRIQKAHDYLQGETGARYPFATSTVWTEDAEKSSHIYAEIDRIFVAADESGQMPFEELLARRIVRVANMEFDGDARAMSWEPSPGVVIDPRFHSGAPCIEGTRIATELIYSRRIDGDSIESLEECYQISKGQIQSAVAWETLLARYETALVA